MKKIMIITPSMGIGGTERIVFEIISRLKKKYRFVLISQKGEYSEILKTDIMHIALPTLKDTGKADFFNTLKIFILLWRTISCFSPQIVHTHHRRYSFLVGIISMLKGTGIHIHTMHNVFSNKKILTSLIKPDFTVGVGRGVYRSLIDYFNYPPKRCLKINNGVNLSKFIPVAKTKMQKIICIGRLTEVKGQRVLLEAFSYILSRVPGKPDFSIDFIGDGPDFDYLVTRSAALGISEWVSFKGFQTNIPQILLSGDLVIVPSLNEGLPLVPLESLAHCVPVIATQIEGTRDVISNGVTGLLVEAGNHKALGDAILFAAENFPTMIKMARNGYRQVSLNYSIDKMINEYDALYHSVLK